MLGLTKLSAMYVYPLQKQHVWYTGLCTSCWLCLVTREGHKGSSAEIRRRKGDGVMVADAHVVAAAASCAAGRAV